jgi:hypothetical protein
MKNMKLSAVAAVAAIAAVAAVAAPAASAGSTGAPCTPKTPTIKGNAAMALCGPASATLSIGGKTYSFHNGFCAEQIPNSDSEQLSLGTDVSTFGGPSNNGGQTFFSMDIAKGHTLASVAVAYVSGRKLIENQAITLSHQTATSGAFKNKGGATSFSGTWNCHGLIVTR